MRRIVAAVLTLTTATYADDPKDLLRASATAIAATNSAAAEVTIERFGGVAVSGSALRVQVWWERAAGTPLGMHLAIRGRKWAADGTATPIEVVCDGQAVFRRVQAEHAMVTARGASAGTSLLMKSEANGNYFVTTFCLGDPYERELAAATLLHEGRAVVDGVSCDVIYAEDANEDPHKARWRVYIGAEDKLPRRYEVNRVADGKAGIVAATIRALRAGAGSEGAFTVQDGASLPLSEYAPAKRPTPLQAGAHAPDFSLRDLEGRQRTLAEFRGKVVVLDHWGIWCIPCVAALPKVQALHADYGPEKVIVIGLNYGDKPEDVAKFVREKGYNYLQLVGADALREPYGVSSWPTMMVIGPDGKVLCREGGGEEAMTRVRKAIDDAAVRNR